MRSGRGRQVVEGHPVADGDWDEGAEGGGENGEEWRRAGQLEET